MGMGYGANSAIMISVENMRKLLPEQMRVLENAIEEEGMSLEDFFAEAELDYIESEDVERAYLELKEAFRQLTTVGLEYLEAYPHCHDSADEGDRYDDVDGAFFTVDGAYVISEPAKKIEEYLESVQWVVFG